MSVFLVVFYFETILRVHDSVLSYWRPMACIVHLVSVRQGLVKQSVSKSHERCSRSSGTITTEWLLDSSMSDLATSARQ